MRVIALIVLAAAVFMSQSQACSAEGAAPDAASKKPMAGRIGTLSPDEARRAERARKRASGTRAEPTKAARVEPPKPAPESPARIASRSKTKTPPPPAPASIAKANERRPTHVKIARVHPTASERRRVAASLDVRHGRLRPHGWPTRRAFAGGQRWVPHVGAVVPAGVPLYPVPPSYQPEYPDAAPAPNPAYQHYYPGYSSAPPGYEY